MPLFCFCSFSYHLRRGGRDVLSLLPLPKSRGCRFSLQPRLFFSYYLLRGFFFFFSMAQGYLPSSSSATSLSAEKGNLGKPCLYSLLFLARKYSSLCPKLFCFSAKNKGEFWVGMKFFYPENSFSFRKRLFFFREKGTFARSQISF